jgi:hypothetical protein
MSQSIIWNILLYTATDVLRNRHTDRVKSVWATEFVLLDTVINSGEKVRIVKQLSESMDGIYVQNKQLLLFSSVAKARRWQKCCSCVHLITWYFFS